MNEQLSTAITTLINKSLDGVDASISFLQSEIPDYIYQLLLWYGVKSAIVGCVFVVVCVMWFRYGIVKPINLIKEGMKEEKETLFTDHRGVIDEHSILLIINAVVIIPIVKAFTSILEALQIWIAPKVWLLEYASDLIK